MTARCRRRARNRTHRFHRRAWKTVSIGHVLNEAEAKHAAAYLLPFLGADPFIIEDDLRGPVRRARHDVSAVTTTLVGMGAASVFHVPSKQKAKRFMAKSPVMKI
jgi:hypothetical protein